MRIIPPLIIRLFTKFASYRPWRKSDGAHPTAEADAPGGLCHKEMGKICRQRSIESLYVVVTWWTSKSLKNSWWMVGTWMVVPGIWYLSWVLTYNPSALCVWLVKTYHRHSGKMLVLSLWWVSATCTMNHEAMSLPPMHLFLNCLRLELQTAPCKGIHRKVDAKMCYMYSFWSVDSDI